MGGTKKKAAVPIKKESKYKIPSLFDCPLCDAKKSIAVKMKRNIGCAVVRCRMCHAGDRKEYPILPLEKAVDVFFRFREELMEQDREFLREHNIQTGAMAPKTGLAQLAHGAARAAPCGGTGVAGDFATCDDLFALGSMEEDPFSLRSDFLNDDRYRKEA
uniref:Transcription elongation factor 1 homolog n=1 Tax=Trypanosoma congolense (strain IL3000) TaxID=1068625 RepID=G0UIY0_TRYCI|nr:conserved hypothetical protein [Trypanosoma congolense IL3000]